MTLALEEEGKHESHFRSHLHTLSLWLHEIITSPCVHMCTFRGACPKCYSMLCVSIALYRGTFWEEGVSLSVPGMFASAHSIWPLALACAEAPRRHVNFGRGGLGDSGNSCLSAQWKERLKRNGSPVGPARRLVCEAAVCSFPLELRISAPLSVGSLSRSVKVSQCFSCMRWLIDETAGSPTESSSSLWCFCLD